MGNNKLLIDKYESAFCQGLYAQGMLIFKSVDFPAPIKRKRKWKITSIMERRHKMKNR